MLFPRTTHKATTNVPSANLTATATKLSYLLAIRLELEVGPSEPDEDKAR